jgi:triosephosphate isomerase
MKKLLIVANLKSYKTEIEAKEWLENLKTEFKTVNLTMEKEVIVCPSFTLLSLFKTFIVENNLNIKLGGQNVSQFGEGAFTGEINAKQIKEFADYVLIGHSERRTNFNETNQILLQKIKTSIDNSLTPIFCIQDSNVEIPENINILAYEPTFAIGSGNPDTPENANDVASKLLETKPEASVLYGGSVTSENVNSFTSKENISGVLVGGASLEAKEFVQIVKNA